MNKKTILIIILSLISVQFSFAEGNKEIKFLDYFNKKNLFDNTLNLREFFYLSEIEMVFEEQENDFSISSKYLLKNGEKTKVINSFLSDAELKQVCKEFFEITENYKINVNFDSLGFVKEDGLYYGGNKDFVEFRSCRMPWIRVAFNKFYFNSIDSMLQVAGFTYNGNGWYESKLPNYQILVGEFIENKSLKNDSTDVFPIAASIDIRESFLIDNLAYFDISFKVTSTDYLCFVSTIPDSLKLINESLYSASSKIYKISDLLK